MKIRYVVWIAAFQTFLNIHAPAATLYVSLTSTNPVPPYADWSTAATNIQDAVDVSTNGDLVLVTNGIYQTGVRLVSGDSTRNRLIVTNAITVESVSGPAVTLIQGGKATNKFSIWVRCVYLVTNATLIGFTLTNGGTVTNADTDQGGGVYCQSTTAVISNCVLVGNSAVIGGGASSGTFNNCIFSNNVAQYGGGGGLDCTLNNCLLVGNSAASGGAVAADLYLTPTVLNNCTIYGNSASNYGGGFISHGSTAASALYCTNCIIFGNTARTGSNYYYGYLEATFNYCCTAPLPTSGVGNFTNDPAFVNAAAGDFHLQSNSPCINSGNNAYITNTTDLDGNPRIVGGTMDIGAYEYQTPTSVLSYAWAQQYGLPTDGSVDYADLDGTGFSVYQDWIAGLNPTNSLSVLAMLPPVPTNSPAGLVVSWESVSNRTYYLQSSTNLTAQPAFSTIQSNLVGQPDMTSFMDTNAVGNGPFFYRVGVQQ